MSAAPTGSRTRGWMINALYGSALGRFFVLFHGLVHKLAIVHRVSDFLFTSMYPGRRSGAAVGALLDEGKMFGASCGRFLWSSIITGYVSSHQTFNAVWRWHLLIATQCTSPVAEFITCCICRATRALEDLCSYAPNRLPFQFRHGAGNAGHPYHEQALEPTAAAAHCLVEEQLGPGFRLQQFKPGRRSCSDHVAPITLDQANTFFDEYASRESYTLRQKGFKRLLEEQPLSIPQDASRQFKTVCALYGARYQDGLGLDHVIRWLQCV